MMGDIAKVPDKQPMVYHDLLHKKRTRENKQEQKETQDAILLFQKSEADFTITEIEKPKVKAIRRQYG